MKYGILGAGEMGLALANVLSDNKKEVLLYNIDKEGSTYFNKHHKSLDRLEGVVFDSSIRSTSSLEEVIKLSDILIVAVPSKNVEELIKDVNKYLNHKVLIVNAAKGLDVETKKGMQQLIKETINKKYLKGIVSLLGPGFAKEIVERNITLICAVSEEKNLAELIQKDFSNEYFRVYLLTDVVGAELGSSLKNVIAIASGILAGLGYGEDTKAAIITRGLIEIRKIGALFNANNETFFGLTGVGDLILTRNSSKSRNYTFGYIIGKEDDAKKALDKNTSTIEGYYTLKAIKSIMDDKKMDLPIINGLYKVIYEFNKPSIVINEIMKRPLKSESIKF